MDATLLETPSTLSTIERLRPAIHRMWLEEAAGRSLPELNEPGWQQLGSGIDMLTGMDRQEVNDQAWRYYYLDPTVRYMVKLHNAYTFSRGISVSARNSALNDWITAFWRNPRNRSTISTAKAQWSLNKRKQLDGEIFFAYYVSTITGQVTVRTFDPKEITKIVYAKGDSSLPTMFVRKIHDENGNEIVEAYPDYRFAGQMAFRSSRDLPPNTEVYVHHVISEEMNGRGVSELSTVIPWVKALKGFMEDRATLTLALATFAFKQKVKGNKATMQRVAAQWADYDSRMRYQTGQQSDGQDMRERRQGANTFIENQASDLEQLKTDSGAHNAYQDMRMFRQQAGIGHGIFEHYLGDPSTGNLATATAMELPMLKNFEFGQQFWVDVFTEMFEFVTIQGMLAGALRGVPAAPRPDITGASPIWVLDTREPESIQVSVNFPPIVQKDIGLWASALGSLTNAETAAGTMMVPPEQKMMSALQALGITNEVSQLIDEWRDKDFELPKKKSNPAPAFGQPNGQQQTSQNADQQTGQQDNQQAATAEAVKRIITAMKNLREADSEDKPKKKLGKPLPKKEAEKVEPITRKSVEKAFDDWADMPSLEDLAAELGLDVEDLDDA